LLAGDHRPLAIRAAGHPIHRVARKADPWTWPDWAYANPTDATFDNRWDDPEGIYRVLYASSQRAGAFVETLARFRVDLELLASLNEIRDDDPSDAPMATGTVPYDWAKDRLIGKAVLKGEFADVTHPVSLTYLREVLARFLLEHGLQDLDASTVRTADRSVTQRMSRVIYECSVSGKRAYDGVYYRSRLGDIYENWGVFDIEVSGVTSPVSVLERAAIRYDDPDFVEALEHLHLAVEAAPKKAAPTPRQQA